MPDRIFGIYGFEFTREFCVHGIQVTPLFNHLESRERAADKYACQLTGYAQFTTPSPDDSDDVTLAHLLVAGMTFAQQQHVAGSVLIEISPGDSIRKLIKRAPFRRPLVASLDRSTFGRAILEDLWAPQSIPSFLGAFISRFRLERSGDTLRQAMYRQLEICRLATPFVELRHFLAFSGLEMLARSRASTGSNRNAAAPIAEFLRSLDFQITQTEVERWTAARNAAFHYGQLTTPDRKGGADIVLPEQLYGISTILQDSCLKLLPFDDGHINWNRWHDRMPFQ